MNKEGYNQNEGWHNQSYSGVETDVVMFQNEMMFQDKEKFRNDMIFQDKEMLQNEMMFQNGGIFRNKAIIQKQNMVKNEGEKDEQPFIAYWKECLIAFLVTFIIATPIFIGLRLMNNVNEIKDVGIMNEDAYDVKTSEDPKADITLNEDEIQVAELKSVNKYNEDVVNILMIGNDQSTDSSGYGNSDSMMMFSINSKEQTMKLVSFLRDSYVKIPGIEKPNKLNSAFNKGGANLLKQTIEQNFCISIDGMVIVHFDTFPTIIDTLGGVDVPLNTAEADFVNLKTNYKYESLTEGTWHLNGEQALWFSRIRYKSSDIFGQMDMGRTARQRYLVNQIYTKYKEQDITDLLKTTNEIVQYIEVDSGLKSQIPTFVKTVASFNLDELESYQCPRNDQYSFMDVVKPNGDKMNVIRIDHKMTEVRDTLHEYVYGDTNY